MKLIASSSSMTGPVLPTTNGHINLFEDLENVCSFLLCSECFTYPLQTQQTIAAAIRASKKTAPAETEKGVPLAPSAKDRNPWYSERNSEKPEEVVQDDRRYLPLFL